MNYQNCNYKGCDCRDGFVPVLGGTSMRKTQAADLQLKTGTESSDDANWRTDSGSGYSSGKSDWASYQSQGCSEDGLGHHSPANTPYKVSDFHDIDWSLDKACWIADKYVKFCDHYWSTDADSPQKCLEDCQNHEHCQKATWFLQEHEESAGEPICVMFAVGAAECEWNGGEYVRPARGQSIECQGPECNPRDENNCFDGSKTETYCKYTEMSAEDYDEMPDYSNNWSGRDSSGLDLSPGEDRSVADSVSWYYADMNRKYEYRCAACPKTPGQCSVYDKYPGDEQYLQLEGGSLSLDYHQKSWAECLNKCFNMDHNFCSDDGCNCLSSNEYNFHPINHLGSFDIEESLDSPFYDASFSNPVVYSEDSSPPFAMWDSAGCAHYVPDQPEPTPSMEPTDKPTDKPTDNLCKEICDIQCQDTVGNFDACNERCISNCNNEILILTDLELAEDICNYTDVDTDPFSIYDDCDEVCKQRCSVFREEFPNSSTRLCQDRCMDRCFYDHDFLVLNDIDLAESFCNYTEYFEENEPTSTTTTTTTTTVAITAAPTTSCDNERTFECPENSSCIPTENTVGYSCQCNPGYYMSINKCRLIAEETKSQESSDPVV